MLSKKFRLRKLNKIIATSVLMGACLILGQGQDASATGFRGVNSGVSGAGAGRGRGTGTGTPGSSSNLSGVGRGSSIGTGSGNLGASGNLGGGRRNSIGTGSGGASSSTFPGLPSSSGVRGTGSSASGSSSTLLGHGGDVRVQRLLQVIQKEIETGNGPNYGTYAALLEEVPNSTKYSNDGVRHKYSSNGIIVEILVGSDGNVKGAFVDTRGASGLSSSDVRGASSSTSSASGGASSGGDKAKVQQLFEKIKNDIQKEEGFSNPKIYKELLTYDPDFINDLGDGRLQYKYSSGGGTVEMVVDSGDGHVKSALLDIDGKSSFIDFDGGWSQTNS